MSEPEDDSTPTPIPDDPLTMPPPFWRHSGVTFQLGFALDELNSLLKKLTRIHRKTEILLDAYYEDHPDSSDADPDNMIFSHICDPLWIVEHHVKLKCELIGFLGAIKAEEELNKFMTYNLPKEVVESSEKLSPTEKLLISGSLLGVKNIKSLNCYGELKKLMAFRNAFAHGHCTDRPIKTIRHNHLVHPDQYPGVPETVTRMKQNAWASLNLTEYLESISKNSYFCEIRGDDERCRETLRKIGQYHIEPFDGSNDIYSIAEVFLQSTKKPKRTAT